MRDNFTQETGDSNPLEKTLLVKCGIPPQPPLRPPAFIRGPARRVPADVSFPFYDHRTLGQICRERACWQCGGGLNSHGRCPWCWWNFSGPDGDAA